MSDQHHSLLSFLFSHVDEKMDVDSTAAAEDEKSEDKTEVKTEKPEEQTAASSENKV